VIHIWVPDDSLPVSSLPWPWTLMNLS